MKIKTITGRQVFDSRGNPTVEAEVTLVNGIITRATAPSGASTGRHEAVELRDADPRRFGGKSVFRAVEHINTEIASALTGTDTTQQRLIDDTLIALDGTPDKKRLGANALLAVSLAAAKAGAASRSKPLYAYLAQGGEALLPMPMIQIIGGGLHANGATDIQDYLIIPLAAHSFGNAMEMTYNVFQATRKLYLKNNLVPSYADEGGFWPSFNSNEDALELLTRAITEAGYEPRTEVGIALDVASTHFFHANEYRLRTDSKTYSREAFVALQESWVDTYPIVSLEDSCAEDDWDGWELISKRLGKRIQLLGDDVFTTNKDRIQKGIGLGICNSVLIKMNQIGTLTETMDALQLTQNAGYLPVVSARSGETEDTTMVDLCVASRAGQLKVGSITRSERLAKYNEMIRIEEKLGSHAVFAGRAIFKTVLP